MLDSIKEVLFILLGPLGTLIDFLIDFFNDIVYLIKLLAKVTFNLESYFTWLPGSAFVLLTSLFGIVVLYKVLGREG